MDGYKAALAAYNVTINPDLVRADNFQFEDGVTQGRALLALTPRPTAIFAANDAGLALPDDLSVVGFDDSSLARQIWPPLTTVRNPSREIAQAAMDLLLRQLAGKEETETALILPTEIVVRCSTGRPVACPSLSRS